MSLFQRHRWFAAAAGFSLAYAAASFFVSKGPALTAFADIAGFVLLVLAAAVAAANIFQTPREQQKFWLLLALGFSLWACNQASWGYFEIILKHQLPEPDFFDIVLFFHVVPFIAAIGWRPDLRKKEARVHSAILNFVLLLGWWIFLYAFIVFPHQYILLNVTAYDLHYDILYVVENSACIIVLLIGVVTGSGGWRRLYSHLLVAELVYTVGSRFLNQGVNNGTYYSGSWYDLTFIAPVAWMAAAALSSRDWNLQTIDFNLHPRWKKLIPRLTMLAILSFPVLGLWTIALDHSSPPVRAFRILTVLSAMLMLGAFVFFRQYFQDQALMSLLQESRSAYATQKELQIQLVQKEKLASLGTLVAGTAHEINHPLNAIMSCSEQLWATEQLSPDQDILIRKILNQARRTRDLVTNLLSFAQQAPGQKNPVDLSVLLHRAVQMLEPRRLPAKIQTELSIAKDLPRISANANQLFQAFVEIIENSIDALEESGGGLLEISAALHEEQILILFSDSGPGVREPLRVFDPFYTTKPVGKGTGLGLSAVYGVVRDHNGQITCHNKPEGGAAFTLLLPIHDHPAIQAASAGQ